MGFRIGIGDKYVVDHRDEEDTPHVRGGRHPLGPLGSSSSQHRWTLELILQEGSAFFHHVLSHVLRQSARMQAHGCTAEFPLTSESIPAAYEAVQNPSDLMVVADDQPV